MIGTLREVSGAHGVLELDVLYLDGGFSIQFYGEQSPSSRVFGSLGKIYPPIAHAPDGLIEAIQLTGHPFGLAVQWHPEWLTDQQSTKSILNNSFKPVNEPTTNLEKHPVPTDPIGIFDSGVGGLSIYREVRRLLPSENILYVADQAHVPYGTRTLEEIRRLSEGITRFLLDNQVKIIVIACNTASAAALHFLREIFRTTLLSAWNQL